MRIVVFAQTVMMFITVMVVMMLGQFAPFFFAVEHHKVLAEGIERGNKYAGQHGKVSKAATGQVAEMHRFDNRIFGIET